MQTNSIAIIVYHLSGNMKSRFTDFLISDGEKPWRHRDQEFDDPPYDRILMLKTWTAGWDCLWAALESIREEDRDRLVSIRNVQHTLTEAFLRQLAHYSYHVGQIVQLGVMQKKEEWQSLSIPKGASEQYNAKAFAQAKCRGHFTDDLLK